jgi:hypothetical protein
MPTTKNSQFGNSFETKKCTYQGESNDHARRAATPRARVPAGGFCSRTFLSSLENGKRPVSTTQKNKSGKINSCYPRIRQSQIILT